jgi:hypothetical protein
MDRKTGTSGKNGVPRVDAMGFPNSNTTNFYDLLYPNTADGVSTPSLTAGLSQGHEFSPASPVTSPEQNFPLTDISAVMFPSADPVEYPNQNTNAGQSYDDILKSLTDDPSFPFPTTLNELKMQRAAGSGTFVPPSSTFTFNGGDSNDQSQMYDNDVQLLGPMPAYMMQGPPFTQQGNSNSGGNSTVNTPADLTSQFLHQQNDRYLGSGSQNIVANVNLDQLLGGEEWSDLNQTSGYAATVSQLFAPPAINQAAGANTYNTGQQQTSQPASNADTEMNSARTSMELNDQPQVSSRNITFNNLNPSALSWNLGAF